MARTLQAQSVASIQSVRFVESGGELKGIQVACEVNYGTMNLFEIIDIFPELNVGQKQTARDFYNRVKGAVESIILG